jgi:hypothetical protein
MTQVAGDVDALHLPCRDFNSMVRATSDVRDKSK